jgi:hypothetical protein
MQASSIAHVTGRTHAGQRPRPSWRVISDLPQREPDPSQIDPDF